MVKNTLYLIVFIILIEACQKTKNLDIVIDPYQAIKDTFYPKIDLNNLENYSNPFIPEYITKRNNLEPISNAKATLGRVLFYDFYLSINNTIFCGSCHIQQFGFSDSSIVSDGVLEAVTTRHSMRILNVKYAKSNSFFWDSRAKSLEDQIPAPIQNHVEMGFSGLDGRPTLQDLPSKLQKINYYKEFLKFVYNDTVMTIERIQECLAQFMRSIVSFDSKYDIGRAQVDNDISDFPNFSDMENLGKRLFIMEPVFDNNSNRIGGGFGCNKCHNAPEFDIDPNSRNNGIVGRLDSPNKIDITVNRAPSLRDLFNPSGNLNSPLMHTGQFSDLKTVIGHYAAINIARGNTNLDNRLSPNGIPQKLNLTQPEVNAVIAFLKTLTGKNIYTDKKWSVPFGN